MLQYHLNVIKFQNYTMYVAIAIYVLHCTFRKQCNSWNWNNRPLIHLYTMYMAACTNDHECSCTKLRQIKVHDYPFLPSQKLADIYVVAMLL